MNVSIGHSLLFIASLAGLSTVGCDAGDADGCNRDYDIPLVIYETQDVYLNASVASFETDDSLHLALQFNPDELTCSDATECDTPGRVALSVPLVGSARGRILDVGQAVVAAVLNEEAGSTVEVLDAVSLQHILRAGLLYSEWDRPAGLAANDGTFIEHRATPMEEVCRAAALDAGHFSGVVAHSDDGRATIPAGTVDRVTFEDDDFIVGVPWSFSPDDNRGGESVVYAWAAD